MIILVFYYHYHYYYYMWLSFMMDILNSYMIYAIVSVMVLYLDGSLMIGNDIYAFLVLFIYIYIYVYYYIYYILGK